MMEKADFVQKLYKRMQFLKFLDQFVIEPTDGSSGSSLTVSLGFGKVGSEVAHRAKGLGMNVIAHDPYAPTDRARAIGVELVSFDEVISSMDFIYLHMPLTATTSKILNDETFVKMKKGVRIINVARGGVIDEDALVRALHYGIVAQADLDVFTEEPPPKDNKLILHELVTATPHLGANTMEAQEGVTIEIAEVVVGALNAATAVNVPMVPSEVSRKILIHFLFFIHYLMIFPLLLSLTLRKYL